jgi:hypothetical protein
MNKQTKIVKKKKSKKQSSISKYGDATVPRVYLISKRERVMHFSRVGQAGDLVQITNNVELFRGVYFTLNAIPGYTEFANLFMEYKIECIEMIITPGITIGYGMTDQAPKVASAFDYQNDSTTTFAALEEYATFKQTKFNRDHVRVFKPVFAAAAYAGTFTSYTIDTGFLQTDYPAVRHYGIKIVITGGHSTQTVLGTFQARYKYHVCFKGLR